MDENDYLFCNSAYSPKSYNLDTLVENEYFEVKIENIFDPSKFWMVINFKELEVFTKYLTNLYSDKRTRIPIPRFKLKRDLICIIYRNGLYHRASILPVLVPEEGKLRVFLMDYGFSINVGVDNIFYILHKHCSVPRFAVRSSLAYISPSDETNSWSLKHLHYFCEMISERKTIAKLLEIDMNQEVLYVEIYIEHGKVFDSVNFLMVQSGIAKYNTHLNRPKHKLSKFKSKLKYAHLFPSFNVLEKGFVPGSLWEHNILKDSVPMDILYKNYYNYQSINAEAVNVNN